MPPLYTYVEEHSWQPHKKPPTSPFISWTPPGTPSSTPSGERASYIHGDSLQPPHPPGRIQHRRLHVVPGERNGGGPSGGPVVGGGSGNGGGGARWRNIGGIREGGGRRRGSGVGGVDSIRSGVSWPTTYPVNGWLGATSIVTIVATAVNVVTHGIVAVTTVHTPGILATATTTISSLKLLNLWVICGVATDL